MESSRLKTKDIITVVLLSLINIVIFASGTFLYATPVTLLLMPLYYALLEGMVVFSIGFKVRKRGAMPMEMVSVKESENLKYVMTHAGKFIMSWGWMVRLRRLLWHISVRFWEKEWLGTIYGRRKGGV